MATYIAKIFYCSGGTNQDLVTATMTVGNCPYTYTTYDDGVCVYLTKKQTISFSLSKAVDFNIRLYFTISWEQVRDNGTPTTGTQTWNIIIPAGTTYRTWQQYAGDNFTCWERRTCYSQDNTAYAEYPSEQ